MKITIVYDNVALLKDTKSNWGFSALINENILFDTGAKGDILLHNMKQLNINPNKIEIVILSHEHWDHIGGLSSLLFKNNNITVYLLKSFSNSFKKKIEKKAKIVEISKSEKITDNIYSTGELENKINEQSLILNTEKGITLITGCSHPGVENIMKIGKNFGEIYGIMGGFHSFNNFEILKNLKLISPMHCTSYISKIEKLYPKSYVKGGVGKVFEV